MLRPVFLNRPNLLGIFNEMEFYFSKKVYVCSVQDLPNISVDFNDSYLIIDHSDDPIKESLFEDLHFSKLNIDANKIIIISPTPDQLFYQTHGRIDYTRVNKKYKSSKKFKHIFCNGHWAKVQNRFKTEFNTDKKIEKLFLCLSREDKKHRRFLNYSLHKHSLFDKGIISHQRTPSGRPFDLVNDLQTFSSRSDFDKNIYMKYGLRKHFVDSLTDDSKCLGKALGAYSFEDYGALNRKVLFELVVESHVDDYLFVTEKLLKPILYKTPFLVLGCPYTLKYLKLLGFKTFDSVFDESYDKELIFYDRVEAILSNIRDISTLSLQDAIKKFKITEEICDYNYNLFLNSDWSFNLQQKIERYINVS